MVHLQILKIRIVQTIIDIVVNLLPYYFTKFRWYRRLIYQSTNKYNPIDLELLNDDTQDYDGTLDMYLYYEENNL